MTAKKRTKKLPVAAPPLRNAKHEAVLQAYFADPKRMGFKAYLVVYPKSSDAAAKTAFSRLLKNADFAARLKFLDRQITEKVVDESVMSAREVLQELSKLGRSSIQNVVVRGDDTEDVIESLRDMSPEHAATVQELTIETYVEGAGDNARDVKRVKVKLHDKRGPLRDLAQHYKLLTENHELAGEIKLKNEETPESMGEREKARRILFLLERAARAGEKPKKGRSA